MDKDKLDKLGYKDVNSGMLVMQVVQIIFADKAALNLEIFLLKLIIKSSSVLMILLFLWE